MLHQKPKSNPEVGRAQRDVMRSNRVAALLKGQESEGYWGRKERFYEHRYGGTAWRYILLAELGADGSDDRIESAAEFLWNTVQDCETGGFVSHVEAAEPVACYTGRLLWAFIELGYQNDPRAARAVEWICDAVQYNDGVRNRNEPKRVECFGAHSCIRGIVPCLRAISALPQTKRSDRASRKLQDGIEYILLHHVYKRSHDLSKVMNQKLTQLSFPNFYFDDFLDILLILTAEGCRDPRMEEAIGYLLKKQCKDGTWRMQRDENHKMVVPIEGKGSPSRWITLRALTVLKRYFSE
jgi:hypothetical protein